MTHYEIRQREMGLCNNSEDESPLLGEGHEAKKLSKNAVYSPPNVPGCISARYALAFLGFFGFVVVYALRVNLSVALVAMVGKNDTQGNTTACPSTSPNSTSPNSTQNNYKQGEFDWDEDTQGLVLGAFFYGYILTQIPGGWLADLYGGKWLFGIGVFFTTLLTLFTPLAARTSLPLFLALRVVEGLGEGVTFPAMHAIWSKWAPPLERSRLMTITYAGSHFGTVLSLPISGLLCDSDIFGGWPAVFYLFGAAGLIWCLAWALLVHETPATHPRISQVERQYIEESIGAVKEKPTSFMGNLLSVPWASIWTSIPVWAIIFSHFANNWGFYTLLTCLPKYMNKILGFNISEDGFLSALPYLVMWVVILLGGQLTDYVRERGLLSTTNARKVTNSFGLVMPGIFLVATGYVGCNKTLAMVFLTIGVGCGGIVMSGYNINHVDIAPAYAGLLMGVTNTFASIPGFAGPAVVGALTNHNQTVEQWRIVFYICAGVYAFGTITYILMGSGVEQEWAKRSRNKPKGQAKVLVQRPE